VFTLAGNNRNRQADAIELSPAAVRLITQQINFVAVVIIIVSC